MQDVTVDWCFVFHQENLLLVLGSWCIIPFFFFEFFRQYSSGHHTCFISIYKSESLLLFCIFLASLVLDFCFIHFSTFIVIFTDFLVVHFYYFTNYWTFNDVNNFDNSKWWISSFKWVFTGWLQCWRFQICPNHFSGYGEKFFQI